MEHDRNIRETCFRWKSRQLLALLLVVAVGSVCWAQASAPAAAPAAQVVEPNEPQVDFSNGVLIKFIAFQKDTSVREGLRLLAVYCKKNIVPYSQVDGALTVSRLYNVTFEQALDAILGSKFKYEQDGDFVKVYTTEELKKIREDPERMVHKVITLYYITADEAAKLVQPVLSTAGKITMTTAAKKTISAGSSGSSSGSSGSSGSSSGLSASSGGGDDMALNDMIVLFDYPENVEKAEAVIREVDSRPRQVLVEATIMSARLNEGMEFGIDWNLLSGFPVVGDPCTGGLPLPTGGVGTNAKASGFATPGTSGLTVGISAGNVQAIITALESVTDVTVLANPKILAVNKQEGSLLIGRKIGYVSATTQNQTSTTQEVTFLQTGTQLVFRPYIGDNGYVRMTIYPKDSVGALSKQTNLPDETTTELMTNVIVKDGQTLVIGGLFRDSTTVTKTQVPVLGNLPVLGSLFRGTIDETQREEVIVLLTPHIIDDPVKADASDRMDDVRLKKAGALKSLQAIDRAKMAETAYASAAKCYLEGDVEKAVHELKIALMIRPTYLEALRLRERIVAETDPEQLKKLDSVVVEKLDEQEAPNWRRY
jgi:type II secretory pathway component GspD/PulD (secretin)